MSSDDLELDRLRARHRLQAQPDLNRVHPTWLVRALQEEPDSVRATVGLARPELAAVLTAAFPGVDTVHPTRAVVTKAAACVQSLWTERLVGDAPEDDDDPPIVAHLTALPSPDDDSRLNRLLVGLGLAKLAYLDDPAEAPSGLSTRWTLLTDRLARTWPGPRDEALRQQARADRASGRESGGPAELVRLGLIGVSRLLGGLDPHRLRWVLQHLPYRSARVVRGHLAAWERQPVPSIAAWEQLLLDHAVRHGLLAPPVSDTGSEP
jgi:hypothetical protein